MAVFPKPIRVPDLYEGHPVYFKESDNDPSSNGSFEVKLAAKLFYKVMREQRCVSRRYFEIMNEHVKRQSLMISSLKGSER